MKIALVGYGKMGKTIDRLAVEKGWEVVLRIDLNNRAEFNTQNLQKADVVIEFSRPESAFENISTCLRAGVPVVSGTTGWLDRFEEIKALCKQQKGGFIYASNFSIGVNLFFALNEYLADMMKDHPDYDVDMEEIHHTQKLDAPSGTAITLAQGILAKINAKNQWVNHPSDQQTDLSIISKRTDPAPGTHSIRYHSAIDDIQITHTAHSREGFAKGALLAAKWLTGKEGVFEMRNVLGF
ncbi:MAG: 4-hydroxy-tetrahydrodipicolinate reductase [Bacteroidota bacterium]